MLHQECICTCLAELEVTTETLLGYTGEGQTVNVRHDE